MIRGISKVCILAFGLWAFFVVPGEAWSRGGVGKMPARAGSRYVINVNVLRDTRDPSLGWPGEGFIMARRGRSAQPRGGFGGPVDRYDRLWGQRYREWESLPPERKRLLRERMQEWKKLSPKERALMRKRYEQWKSLSPEEQTWIQNQLRRWKELSPKEREMIRQMFLR